jgi:4'-phosphopantetheinyl transferase
MADGRTTDDVPIPGPGAVHVWVADTTTASRHLANCRELLTEEELDRAQRYVGSAEGRFVVTRALLRHVLSRYLHSAPRSIVLSRRCAHCGDAAHGKPFVSAPDPPRPFSFSVSHTREKALLAASGREVGVDIERISGGSRHRRALDAVLSEADRRFVLGLPDRERRRARYDMWARKEAYLKGIGLGLTGEMQGVSVADVWPTRWCRVADGRPAAATWWVTSIDVGADYATAVAVKGQVPVASAITVLYLSPEEDMLPRLERGDGFHGEHDAEAGRLDATVRELRRKPQGGR